MTSKTTIRNASKMKGRHRCKGKRHPLWNKDEWTADRMAPGKEVHNAPMIMARVKVAITAEEEMDDKQINPYVKCNDVLVIAGNSRRLLF